MGGERTRSKGEPVTGCCLAGFGRICSPGEPRGQSVPLSRKVLSSWSSHWLLSHEGPCGGHQHALLSRVIGPKWEHDLNPKPKPVFPAFTPRQARPTPHSVSILVWPGHHPHPLGGRGGAGKHGRPVTTWAGACAPRPGQTSAAGCVLSHSLQVRAKPTDR